MRAFFDLLLAPWLNRRAVSAIAARIAGDERLSGTFDLNTSAIYRVTLQSKNEVTLRYDSGPEPRTVHRSILELVGLGPRLYVVDSAPLALLAKPTAFVVFDGFNTEPESFDTGEWHLYINNSAFPFWDAAALRDWAVFNRPLLAAAADRNVNPFADAMPGPGIIAEVRRPRRRPASRSFSPAQVAHVCTSR